MPHPYSEACRMFLEADGDRLLKAYGIDSREYQDPLRALCAGRFPKNGDPTVMKALAGGAKALLAITGEKILLSASIDPKAGRDAGFDIRKNMPLLNRQKQPSIALMEMLCEIGFQARPSLFFAIGQGYNKSLANIRITYDPREICVCGDTSSVIDLDRCEEIQRVITKHGVKSAFALKQLCMMNNASLIDGRGWIWQEEWAQKKMSTLLGFKGRASSDEKQRREAAIKALVRDLLHLPDTGDPSWNFAELNHPRKNITKEIAA